MKGTTGNCIVFRQFEISRSKIYFGMIVRGKNNHLVLSLILFVILFPGLNAQIEFTYQSDYSYVKGKDAASLPATWMNPGFDYSGWTKGKAPFRYGNGTGGTELSDMQNSYTTIFLRSTFECSNKDLIQEINNNGRL